MGDKYLCVRIISLGGDTVFSVGGKIFSLRAGPIREANI